MIHCIKKIQQFLNQIRDFLSNRWLQGALKERVVQCVNSLREVNKNSSTDQFII